MKLSILLVVVAIAFCQMMVSLTSQCPVSPQYISAINSITDSTLSTLSTDLPVFRPLTRPLGYALKLRLPLFRQTPTVGKFNETVTRYRRGINLFVRSLLAMLDKWHVEADIRKERLPSMREAMRLNEVTRTTMDDLGRQYPRLRPFTSPLPFALYFNPFTGRGGSTFNWNLDPATVEYNLLILSGNLTQMASRWSKVTDRFLALEEQCRSN